MMEEEGPCKYCKYAYATIGTRYPFLTCSDMPGAEGRWYVVEPDGSCPNFEPKYEQQYDPFTSYQ